MDEIVLEDPPLFKSTIGQKYETTMSTSSSGYLQNWDKIHVIFKENKNSTQGFSTDFERYEKVNAHLHSAHVCRPEKRLPDNHNKIRREKNLLNTIDKNSKSVACCDIHNHDSNVDKCASDIRRLSSSTTNKELNRLDEHIHKPSVQRQDSTTLDIGLGNHVQAQHELENQKHRIQECGKTEDPHSKLFTDRNLCLQARQAEVCYQNKNHLQGVDQESSYKSGNGMLDARMPSEQINDNSSIFHGCKKSNFSEKSHPEAGQILPWLFSGSNHQQPGERKLMKVWENEPVNFAKDFIKKNRNVDKLQNDGSKTWCWPSTTRQDVLMAAMFVVLLVLVMSQVHLHSRVGAMERSAALSTRRCRCVKDADVASANYMDDDINNQIKRYLDNIYQEFIADGNHLSDVPSSYSNGIIKESFFLRNDQRKDMPTASNGNVLFELLENLKTKDDITIFKSSSLKNNVIKTSSNDSSVNENINVEEAESGTRITDVSNDHSTGGVQNIHLLTHLWHKKEPARSLRVRRGTKEKDAGFTEMKRNQDKEDKNVAKGKKKRREKNENTNTKFNSETYEARFFEYFPFSKYFMDKDCAEHTHWKKGILGCKDASVIIPHKHTVLPFYDASSQTAQKDPKTRMLVMDNKKPGEFHVNIPGDYLVQLNITVVVENPHHDEKHFLALYLNNQSMLACHQGGFRCPRTNEHTSNKYKICNIIGLLELRKDDTLDIRTMAEDMTVRMEKNHNTYFRIVLFNKIK